MEEEGPGLLTLQDAHDEGWDFGSLDIRRRRMVGWVFPECESDVDNEGGNSLEQYDDGSHLGENTCAGEASDVGFCEDAEVLFGRGVGSFGSRPEGLELLMALGSPKDFSDEPWELNE